MQSELSQLLKSTVVRLARGMSQREIAEEDEVTESAVRSRILALRDKTGEYDLMRIVVWCLWQKWITFEDVFDSPTKGKASGMDVNQKMVRTWQPPS